MGRRHDPSSRPGVAPGSPSGLRAARGPDRAVAVVAVATMACTYALVALGSTVRVTESGMGCPSWPLCYGQVGPVDHFHALLEQSHRYLVALVTLGVLATVVLARRSRSRRLAYRPALVAAGIVALQAGLGALTVFAKNAPWTVAVHLVVGLVFLASTVVVAVAALRARRGTASFGDVGPWGWAALGATLLVVVGGSLVVASGAAPACPSWPLCPGAAPGRLVAFQLLHRSLAGLAGVVLVGFVASRWRSGRTRRGWRAGSAALVCQLVVVAAFGAASALSRAAAAWQDVHLAMVGLLWGLLVALVSVLATSGPAPGVEVGAPAPARLRAAGDEPAGEVLAGAS